MKNYFTSNFFINNRKILVQKINNNKPIILTANGLLQRRGDSPYKFSQEPNFWYLSGIEESDIILVINSQEEYLIIPDRGENRKTFDGEIDINGLSERSGINQIYNEEQGWLKIVHDLKLSQGEVNCLPESAEFISQYGFYVNPANKALRLKLVEKTNGQIKFNDISKFLILSRMVKQDCEITAIKTAIKITLDGIEAIKVNNKSYNYQHEYQIEADLTNYFITHGAVNGHAFNPIVASGLNACTLHNVSNKGQLAKNDLIVLDVGAEVEQYAADITRTISLSQPTMRQKEVLQAVLEMQQYAFSIIKSGILLKEYEQMVEDQMGLTLFSLGLLTKNQIDHEHIRHYYPHATSHFLGLNVHDVGDYSMPLPLNAIITVEPGIYIEKEKIGVRIEDDVLITEDGIKVLSDQ